MGSFLPFFLKSNEMKKQKLKIIPLIAIMDFWTKQKLTQDKGGSFNLDLYLSICRAKQNLLNIKNNEV